MINPASRLESARDAASVYDSSVDRWLDLPGVNGRAESDYTTAPPSNEVTLTARIQPDLWLPTSYQAILGQHSGSVADSSIMMDLYNVAPAGRIIVNRSNGTVGNGLSFTAIPETLTDATTKLWVRVWARVDPVGTIRFTLYYSFDNTNDESTVTWVEHETINTTTNPTLNAAATYPWKVGIRGTSDQDFFGRIYTVSVRNGGPTAGRVVNPRFYYAKEWQDGDDALDTGTDDRGVTWTLQADATIQDGYGGLLD